MACEARVDHIRLQPVRRPEEERAEEERGEPDSDRGAPAEQRDRDPEEPDARSLDVRGPDVEEVAEHVEAARETREGPGDGHRAHVVRAYLDPAVGGRVRV